MGQQMVGEQDGLGGLQVGLAGHDGVRVRGGLIRQCRDDVESAVGDPGHGVAQPHPEQSGHLVVAGASSPQSPAQLGADPFDQTTLQRAVNVLVGGDRDEAAVGDIGAEPIQSGQQPVALLVGEQTRAVQHLGMRLGGRHVVGRQHPVEMGRAAQCGQFRRGAVGEPGTPQRPLVGAHRGSLSRSPRSRRAAIFDESPCT